MAQVLHRLTLICGIMGQDRNMHGITARTRLKLLAGAAAYALTGCRGVNDREAVADVPVTNPPLNQTARANTLRETFHNNFYIGAAISLGQLLENGVDVDIIKSQFSSVTAEFEMKPAFIAPTEGVFDFSATDQLLDFAEANNLQTRGHTLLWHDGTPAYFFHGSIAQVKARLEAYVTAVVTRYKDRIHAWDVVNEVITDDDFAGSPYRQSNWHTAAGGPDYIDWALQAARAADPNAELFINDYQTERPGKRAHLMQVIADLVARNIPLDGIGHQMHLFAETSTPAAVLQAIDDVETQFPSLINHITELDINVYNDLSSCYDTGTNCDPDFGNNLPETIRVRQVEIYREIFEGFKARSSVQSVSLWGVRDNDSWLNFHPVNRTNYPLLFRPDGSSKDSFRAITEPDFKCYLFNGEARCQKG